MRSPPTRPALRARYDDRRQRVVNVAARVFAERGYHATSIDDLIAATGLTRGGLYHYIASKEELLFAILDELMDPLLGRARAIVASPGTPEVHLRRLTREWLEHIAGHREHMIVFNRERRTLERDPRWEHVREARREFERLLGGVLRRGSVEGSLRIGDEAVTLLALLGMVNYTAQWLLPSGRLRPGEIADRYCDLLLDGIRPRRPAAP